VWGNGTTASHILTSAADGCVAGFTPRWLHRPGNMIPAGYKGWMGLKTYLNAAEKKKIVYLCLKSNSDSAIVQFVAHALY
jgi:hypothetical protein